MALPRIIYDNSCPICRIYGSMIEHKIGKNAIEGYASEQTAEDFEYINAAGQKKVGIQAIEELVKDFPAVKDYMYMLPEKYRTIGLKLAYKVGKIVRKAYGVVKKGCNCGKKK